MRQVTIVALGTIVVASVGAIVLAGGRAAESTSSPLEPEGTWHWVLIAGGAVSFLGYVAATITFRRKAAPLATVLVIGVVVQLLPLLGPVLLSRDVYAYWAYGRIAAVHDSNPYSEVPAAFAEDPAVRRMGTSWLETTTIYGPVWTLVAVGVSEAADSATAATYAFRAIAAASMVAIVGLAALLARNRAFAAAFVGWNPLLALHFAGGGHNDALMMALALAALALSLRKRPAPAGLLWIASIAVKWVAAAFAGLVLLRGRFRERRLLAGMVAGALVVAVTSFSLYGFGWLDAGSGLSTQARRTGSIGLSGWLGDVGLGHRATLGVIAVATLAVAAWLGWQAWRGRIRLGLAGVLLAALQGWLNPWYAVWGVSLAAPEEDTAAHVGAVLLTGLLLRDALPL